MQYCRGLRVFELPESCVRPVVWAQPGPLCVSHDDFAVPHPVLDMISANLACFSDVALGGHRLVQRFQI